MTHVNFSPDRPILAQHLNILQRTLLEALQQLRLALGGAQIFYGLEVYPAAGSTVQVLPGLAFDGLGRPLPIRQPLRVPLPGRVDRPRILALRYQSTVEEETDEGEPLVEGDGVEVIWLWEAPAEDSLVPLATVRPDHRGHIIIESDVARRAAAAAHRHTGELMSDQAGHLRYDGDLVAVAPAGPTVSPADLNVAMASLRRELLDRIELRDQAMAGAGIASAPAAPPEPPPIWAPELGLVDGIGKGYAQQLAEVGVETVPGLLAKAHSLAGRQELSRATGIPTSRLEAWARFADLMRLHGVVPEHVRLLLDAGFDSVADLAAVEPAVVYDRIRDVFRPERHQLHKAPPLSLVRAWVHEARRLPPVPFE
ncbi:MAG: DUF4332 domain-containing protein [Ardenticatenaceae bacterium]|nr:DUF4332 domain-containing protein [Ardenticatenaceae bacterium]HBY98116.1 hypothetical protein [Chloroflexota bacterium]